MKIICPNCDHDIDINMDISERELEISILASKGLCNGDIGTELWISEKTVKNHMSRIFKKLHIKNRFFIVRYLLDNHFVRAKDIGNILP